MSAGAAGATSVSTPPVEGAVARVPDTVGQALILSRYQLRDYLRSRRFLLMIAIVVALGAILTLVVAHFRPTLLLSNPNEFYGGVWAGGAAYLILFAGIIFGGDAIAGEFQNKTGYFLMGLPLRRVTVYVGKYLAVLVASIVSLLVYLVVVVANAVAYFGAGAFSDPGQLLSSFALALLYLLALMGFVFLFSSLFKTSLYAVLVVAVLFLIGFSILQSVIVALTATEPWYLLSYVNGVIAYPLTGVPAHIAPGRAGGGGLATLYSPTYAEGIGVMLGYFFLTTIGGLFLFEREEFT